MAPITRPLLATLLLGVVVVGCDGDGETSDGAVGTAVGTSVESVTTLDPSTTTSPGAPTTDAPAPTTTTDAPAPTTTTDVSADGFEPPPAQPVAVSLDVPTGEFVAAPGDLVVLRTNGDLEYRPNALSPGNEAPPIVLLDRPDAPPDADEGPSPNVVSDVAAFVDGSVVYGECCEPVSGNLFAVDAPDSDVGALAVGHLVDQSPDGSRLATASDRQLSVVDVESGEGNGLLLEQTPDRRLAIVDIEWADDDTLMVIVSDDQTHWIVPYDATTLTVSSTPVNLDPDTDHEDVRFAGRSPNGDVVVAAAARSGAWDVLEFDPGDLDGDPALRENLPSSVSHIETDAGGLGHIWIDGATLQYLGPDQREARPIGDGIEAAWFVEPS